MKWLRKLMGLDYPDPEVGQVWRCQHNGELMQVTSIDVSTVGVVGITVRYWMHTGSWPASMAESWSTGNRYCYGLTRWRMRLKEERRVLVPESEHPVERRRSQIISC